MKKLAYMATFVGALGLVACGGGGGGGDDISINPDGGGGGGGDGGGNPAACNPVTQQGCDSGEKCSWLVENPDMGLGRTACVPNGDAKPGDACMFDMAAGYDNCQATDSVGYICSGGVCTEACSQTPSSTCSDGYCVLVNGLFDDLDNIGLCAPRCDTHLQNCPVEGDGCYMFTPGADADPPVDGICFGVPPDATELKQGDTCLMGANGCFLNGCAAGFGPELLADGAMSIDLCAFYCEPIETYWDSDTSAVVGGPAVGNATAGPGNDVDASCSVGNGAGGSHCRYIASSYSFMNITDTDIPKTIGFCAPTDSSWGDCTTYSPKEIAAAIADATDAMDAQNKRDAFCMANGEKCAFGCVTPETLASIFDTMGASSYALDAMLVPPQIQGKERNQLLQKLHNELRQNGFDIK